MVSFNAWAASAETSVPVRQTLQELGYEGRYISIIEKIFNIRSTPVSGRSPTDFLLGTRLAERCELQDPITLSFTHTGQEVYPFGYSTLKMLNRMVDGSGPVFGSTASNCVSTFKIISLYRRARYQRKHVVFTCDTAFTGILREIPNTTVTGDACSALCLEADASQRYTVVEALVATYPEHCGGAWEDEASRYRYEQEYTNRIVAIIHRGLEKVAAGDDQRIAVVPHNVNAYTWNKIKSQLNDYRITLLTDCIDQHGHCFGSDAFLNLQHFERRRDTGPDRPDYFFCVTAGVGGFFSLLVLK